VIYACDPASVPPPGLVPERVIGNDAASRALPGESATRSSPEPEWARDKCDARRARPPGPGRRVPPRSARQIADRLKIGCRRVGALLLVTGLLLPCQAAARPTTQVKTSVQRAENVGVMGESLILPYAFSAESTELVFGLGGMRKGFYQEQMLVGGTAFGGANSYGGFAGVWDYRFPFSRRAFISVMGMLGYYPNHRAYTAPRAIFIPEGVERPGSNDSDQDHFIEAEGQSNWWEIKLDYVLPIGATAGLGRVHYELARGLLTSAPSGGERWNPLESGVTIATLRQYNRYQTYETGQQFFDGTVHPFELGLLYDNTDFTINPARGSSQYVAVHHDPAWLDSEEKWTFVEAEASKYFSLGHGQWSSQRILALNGWTAYSPSWKLEQDGAGGSRVENGPPFMEGASLGGFYRLRGYRDGRFHDKAAIYATAEYRYTLRHNPVRDVEWLRFMKLDWLQLVGFVEGGRVAPHYAADTLFEDWQSDFGASLRALTAGIVVRLDVAHSDEGTNVWVMVGHPF
jgi:hypothetical protein